MTPARKTAGRVAFVGSGPGDAGLLTVRAQELLAKADEAAKALKVFGPKAETVVLDLIKNTKDNFTIKNGCKVLEAPPD